MATASLAPSKRSGQAIYRLLAAALGSLFSVNAILAIGTSIVLLLWAADAIGRG